MAYQFESRVRYSETGLDKKLSLVSLADYFQDCSTFQSEDIGLGIQYLAEQHRVWMILSWQIEILRRPALGEKITVETWPYGFKAFYGYRNFTLRDEQGQYLAKANSVWASIDTESGRPTRVLPEHVSGYVNEPALEMEYSSRKLQIPDDCVKMESFPVGRHLLDTNHHVNNGQYIRIAEEFLPPDFEVACLKVEYRQQARLHDVIVPMVHCSDAEVTVCLCDEQEKPYAIVSFSR